MGEDCTRTPAFQAQGMAMKFRRGAQASGLRLRTLRSARIGLVLFTCVLWGAAASSQTPPRLDASGDELPDSAIQRLGTTRFRTEAPLRSVAIAPDGRFIYAALGDRGVVCWDASTGKTVRTFGGYGSPIAISPDGKLLGAAIMEDVAVVDAESGTVLRRIHGNRAQIVDLAWSPDGKRIAAAACTDDIFVWNAETTRREAHFRGPIFEPGRLAWTADGKRLAFPGPEKTVLVVDVATKSESCRLELKNGMARAIALTSDGRILIVSEDSPEGGRLAWDLESAMRIEALSERIGKVSALALNPEGTLLAVVGPDRTRVLEVPGGAVRFDAGPDSSGIQAMFSPDSRRLMLARGSGVRVWDLDPDSKVPAAGSDTVPLHAIAWMPDGRHLLAPGAGGALLLWSIENGRARAIGPTGGIVRSLSLSDDGRYVATTGWDAASRVTEMATGKAVYQMEANRGWRAVCLPGGHRVAIAAGQEFRMIDLDSMTVIASHKGRDTDGIQSLSAQGNRIAAVRWNSATILDSASAVPLRVVEAMPGGDAGEKNGFMDGQLSPDGKCLLLARSKGTLELQVSEDGRIVWNRMAAGLADEPGRASASTFSPDGRFIAYLSGDSREQNPDVRLIESATGTEIRVIRTPESVIRSFAFSPDSRLIALGLENGSALVYPIQAPGMGTWAPAVPLEKLLVDLESPEAAPGWLAVWTLAQFHADGVDALKMALLQAPETGSMGDRVRDLDSEEVATRNKAIREILALGIDAEALLESARKTVEARARVDELLATIRGPGADAESTRRMLRGVAALEINGGDEARKALQAIASEHASARARAEAAAALKRLES